MQTIATLTVAPDRSRLVLAAIAVYAVILHLLMPPTADVAWLITAAERLLDGQHLYSDILETNPPMAVWLYVPSAWLGRLTGLAPETLVNVQTVLAGCASLAIAGAIWPRTETLFVRLLVLAAVLVLPGDMFAQREHYALLGLLPLIALTARRYEGGAVARWSLIAAGVGEGLALSIKPHFVIIVALMSLLAVWRRRSLRPLLGPEHVIALALLLAYGLVLILGYPAFLTENLPAAEAVYVPDRLSIPVLMLLPHVVLVLIILIAALTIYRRQALTGPTPILLATIAGGLAVYAVQGKGWAYHLLPATIIAAIAIVRLVLHEDASAKPPILARSALAAFLLLPPTAAAVHMAIVPDTLVTAVESYGPGIKLATITGDIGVGSPLHRTARDTFVNSGPALWRAKGALSLYYRSPSDRTRRLLRYADMDRQTLTRDLLASRPGMILAETAPFDWLSWAREDTRLAAILDRYSVVQAISGSDSTITLLRLKS